MPLLVPGSPDSKGILRYITFNQDCSCIVIGTSQGIKIYDLELNKIVFDGKVGAVGIAELLFCTSLLAYVGTGEQPSMTPRKLTLYDSTKRSVIHEQTFSARILRVCMNRARLVAVMERRANVYDLNTMQHLRMLDTPANAHGLCSLSACTSPSHMVLPTSATTGALRVYDVMVDGGNVLCDIPAHQHPTSIAAWSSDGSLLATASSKGTIIRVHSLPQAVRTASFRRGSYAASIHALAFTPAGLRPAMLCAASSNGTIHLFRLEPTASLRRGSPGGAAGSGMAGAAATLLSSVMPASVSDALDMARDFLVLRLPCNKMATLCTFKARPGKSANGATVLTVVVVTESGLLYEYALQDLDSGGEPSYSLEKACSVLGSSPSS